MEPDYYELAFNQWMDDYVKNPDAFEDSTKAALTHLREKVAGGEPTYGESCTAIFREYVKKVSR